jgi:DNA-binding CsgD family transcriptional regulator
MKHEPNVIRIQSTSEFRLDPALTSEEAIILRALVAEQTEKQVCNGLRMDPETFLRMMRDMREKIGTANNVSLIAWAKRQIKGADQRIDRRERHARLA